MASMSVDVSWKWINSPWVLRPGHLFSCSIRVIEPQFAAKDDGNPINSKARLLRMAWKTLSCTVRLQTSTHDSIRTSSNMLKQTSPSGPAHVCIDPLDTYFFDGKKKAMFQIKIQNRSFYWHYIIKLFHLCTKLCPRRTHRWHALWTLRRAGACSEAWAGEIKVSCFARILADFNGS